MSIIYKILNKITGEFYIGKTTGTLESRFNGHVKSSKRGTGHLHRSIKTYGAENFSIELIEETSIELLNEREIYHISILNPTLNMTKGGEGGSTTHNYMWVNNDIDNKYMLKIYDIPDGFIRGRINSKFNDIEFQTEMSSRTDRIKAGKTTSESWKSGKVKKRTDRKKGVFHHSKETCDKLRGPRGPHTNPHKETRILTCPYCNKTGGLRGMLVWHFENCRSK